MNERRRTSGRPTKEDAERLDVMVLAAARAAFLEYGFQAASMSEIANRIGAAKPTIYKRYKSKGALLMAMIDGEVAKLERFVRDATLASRPTLDALRAAAQLLFDYTSVPDELAFRKLLYGEAATKPFIADQMSQWRLVLEAPLVALVSQCQEAGEIGKEFAAEFLTDILIDLIATPLDRIALEPCLPEPAHLAQLFEGRWRAFERIARA
jgi:AcrR family transcriptional regulator